MANASEKGWCPLGIGLLIAAVTPSVGHRSERNFEDFGGWYSPNSSLLIKGSVSQFDEPVLLDDCPRSTGHLQLLWTRKAK